MKSVMIMKPEMFELEAILKTLQECKTVLNIIFGQSQGSQALFQWCFNDDDADGGGCVDTDVQGILASGPEMSRADKTQAAASSLPPRDFHRLTPPLHTPQPPPPTLPTPTSPLQLKTSQPWALETF